MCCLPYYVAGPGFMNIFPPNLEPVLNFSKNSFMCLSGMIFLNSFSQIALLSFSIIQKNHPRKSLMKFISENFKTASYLAACKNIVMLPQPGCIFP